MLYDNAQLLPLYADAWLATGDALFRRVALETGAWIMREMQSLNGGYYSTLDADSEGHEGKFYAWDVDEIKKLLTPEAATATSLSRGPRLDPIGEEWEIVEQRYGLRGEPNFEGHWHLNVRAESGEEGRLDTARAKLFAAREKRVRPGRDEKILTSWNGMMIRAMAHAGRLLGREDFVDSAARAFDFVRAQLWRDGRLLATTKDGKTHLNAYLDDYVHLIDAGLALLQARFRAADLDFIRNLADIVLARFEDKARGGFYFTSDDHERLLHRPKPAGDDAIPSGNGVAAQALLRLGHLLGETRYLDAAERTLTALAGAVAQYPSAHCGLLLALDEYLNPPQTIVLRGAPDALRSWHARCGARYAPGRAALAIPADVTNLAGLPAERRVQGNITAYICSGHACQALVSTFEDFDNALRRGETG
ncbi:MAG: hypothetical protein A2V91_04545 [Candidatus Muproteobacteria bacterium RBG_16_64_10]|uniref:Thioredoxin domain-containing protein n=1 Tax=Candidatus Muproteobacteria bacterium RBG_16_64_10 TaxID=1817757 RepID=A0A1F6T7B8_9PROT|nr:MAG: hypothetical protein A2V91_04545 [Candidatus Muproteobacteria bacterium RBG_16_64_10]